MIFSFRFFNSYFQTFIPREVRRDTNKIYKKMTLNQYIKNTGLVAGSSNVGIFSFVFCIICYLRVLLPLCQKLIVISFCLCSHWSKKIERARNERRIKGRAKSDKEGDNMLQGHVQTKWCLGLKCPSL